MAAITNAAVADRAAEVVPASSSPREEGYTAETLTFEGLYRDCARPIYHFVLRSVRDPQDAEDICQEVWTRVYRRLPTLREAAAARVWLYRIARYAIIDAARRRSRRPQHGALTFDPRAAATDEPAPLLIASEQAAFAWQALAALQPRQRMALYLKEVEERSYRDIAEVLECSESAVETLLFRARRRFAEHYGCLAESREGRCAQARRTMAIVLDGEGDAVEERAVQAHLDECSKCREALTGARRTSAARAALPLLPVPLSAPLTGSGLAEVAATAIEAVRAVVAKFAVALAGKTSVAAGTAATTGAIAVATLAPAAPVDHSAATMPGPSADVAVAALVEGTVGTSSTTGVTPDLYISSLDGVSVAVVSGLGLEASLDTSAGLDVRLASAPAIMAVTRSDERAALDIDASLPATLHSVATAVPTVVVSEPVASVASPQPLDVVEAAALPPLAERAPPANEIQQALVPAPVLLAPPLSSALTP